MRWGGTPRAPPLWIPAFAGMTREGAGMTREGAGMTIFAGMTIGGVGDGERCWGVGALRQAQGERGWEARVRWGGGMRWGETPRAPPLPWVPACAGTTGGWLRANGFGGARDGVGGCVGGGGRPLAARVWVPAFAGMTGGVRRNDARGVRGNDGGVGGGAVAGWGLVGWVFG